MVRPLKSTWVTPNHLTTVRLGVGLGAAAAFLPGSYGWSNLAALLLVLSNFLDHADGELARLSGKGSRLGHYYDLASDALVTILLFVAMGAGIAARDERVFDLAPTAIGMVAGVAIAAIFYLRMRIEDIEGKAGTRQATLAGFETEDVLYLMPLATLLDGVRPLLLAAGVCAPLYAGWVVLQYRKGLRRWQRVSAASTSSVAR